MAQFDLPLDALRTYQPDVPESPRFDEFWSSTLAHDEPVALLEELLGRIDARLTRRQVQVCARALLGMTNVAIGLDLGVPIPTMNSAIEARFISRDKAERVAASKEIEGPTAKYTGDKKELIDAIRAALYASKIIASVPQGATFEVEARSRNGAWYLVSYQDIRGWVSAPYVRLLDGTASELVVSAEIVPVPPMGAVFVPGAESGAAVTVRGAATAKLIVRDAASTQGAEIGRIEAGTEFVVLGRNTTGAWYLIPFEGGQGWVYSPFVTLIEGRVPDLPIR